MDLLYGKLIIILAEVSYVLSQSTFGSRADNTDEPTDISAMANTAVHSSMQRGKICYLTDESSKVLVADDVTIGTLYLEINV